MPLNDEFERTGAWLFRYRSFVPLTLVPLFVGGLYSFTYWERSHALTEVWQCACLFVSLLGLGVRVATVGFVPDGTSGRNTSGQRAESLNTTGLYSIVRHPLYLGNYLVFLGIALLFRSWSLLLLVSCLYALYYERIMMAEEAFLRSKFGEAFESWADITPAFLPRIRNWRSPSLPFNLRSVLRRECTSPLLIASIFALFDLLGDSWVEHRLVIDWRWFTFVMAACAGWVGLRMLKRRTRLLQSPGR